VGKMQELRGHGDLDPDFKGRLGGQAVCDRVRCFPHWYIMKLMKNLSSFL
jgi:hypothetical protein